MKTTKKPSSIDINIKPTSTSSIDYSLSTTSSDIDEIQRREYMTSDDASSLAHQITSSNNK